MSDEGRPLICDFGLARIVPESISLSNTTNARGSFRWMASEFFEERPVTEHSRETDVWGFGATVFVSLMFVVIYESADICTMFSNCFQITYLTRISNMTPRLYTPCPEAKILRIISIAQD